VATNPHAKFSEVIVELFLQDDVKYISLLIFDDLKRKRITDCFLYTWAAQIKILL